MSIMAILDGLEDHGVLVRYLPPSGGQGKRRLYLTAEFRKELGNNRSAIQNFDQKAAIAAIFDSWIPGDSFVARLSGFGNEAALALLEPPPPEIWEFRVRHTRPQVRVFARFAAQDVLVAFLARNRDSLGPARHRSGKKSLSWQEAMYGCEAEWTRIFGGAAPFRGTRVDDYISENASECT